MAITLMVIGAISAPGLDTALVWSLRRPDARWWPPRNASFGWQALVIWALSIVPFVAGGLAGLWDNSTLSLSAWGWRAVGLAAMTGACILLAWGIGTLSWAQTVGQGRELITHGPYRWTRNPQYLGDILLAVGFVLWSDSSLALAVAVPLIAALVLFRFTEEPWLAELFGKAYEDYRGRVPRFIGLPSQV